MRNTIDVGVDITTPTLECASKVELEAFFASLKEKRDLREKHEGAEETRPNRAFLKKLDGTQKKNSAFVNKLKTCLTVSQSASVLQNFEKQNLTQFVDEVAAALASIGPLRNIDDLATRKLASLIILLVAYQIHSQGWLALS